MNNQAYVITRYDIAATIANESPRAAELLADYGLHCMGCYFSENDTLEVGARIHGMDEEDINLMIEEINMQLEKEWIEAQGSSDSMSSAKNL